MTADECRMSIFESTLMLDGPKAMYRIHNANVGGQEDNSVNKSLSSSKHPQA